MKLRKAKKGEAEKIANIEYNSGYRWRTDMKKEIKYAKKILKPGFFTYIIEEKNKGIAYFSIIIKNKICAIAFLSVIKSHQGKKLASELMNKIIKIAKNKKCKRIKLEVWTKNFPAIGLYNKFSFYVSGIKRKYYPNKDDKLIMEKIIKT